MNTSQEHRALETLKTLVSMDTRTQTPQENAAMQWLRSKLESIGLETHIVVAEEDRLNVVGIWKGTGDGPSLMFNGHIDTNPLTLGWTHEPWAADSDETFVYGLGISNMKAGCSAYLEAVRVLQDEGWQPAGDIILTFVVGELQHGVGTRAVIDAGYRADYFVNCEPTDLTAMTTHAGSAEFLVRVTGATRHLSKREEAGDALSAAARLIDPLDALKFPDALDEDALATNRTHVGVFNSGLGDEMSPSRPPQVADVAELRGSARFGPGQDAERALEQIERLVEDQLADTRGVSASVERVDAPGISMDRPFSVDKSSRIVSTLQHAYREVTGRDQPTGAIQPYCFYGSDASLLQHLAGMTGVVCGPGGKYNTMPDERVAIKDYLVAVDVYANVIRDICGD